MSFSFLICPIVDLDAIHVQKLCQLKIYDNSRLLRDYVALRDALKLRQASRRP